MAPPVTVKHEHHTAADVACDRHGTRNDVALRCRSDRESISPRVQEAFRLFKQADADRSLSSAQKTNFIALLTVPLDRSERRVFYKLCEEFVCGS